MKLYYEEPYIKISWDEEISCVLVEWKGYAQSEEFRVGMEAALKLIKEKVTSKLLLDLRSFGPINQENQEWLALDWLPRATSFGPIHAALIMPTSKLAALSVGNAISRVDDKIKITYVDNIEAARQWLRFLTK